MLKIENFEVLGWEHAIRGMRNPMNSWEKSDSLFCMKMDGCDNCRHFEDLSCPGVRYDACEIGIMGEIGPNDHQLMTSLAKGGPVHAKYRRMITVYLDITAPLYWWKEFDTYKVGTVANSCSTMHKIHAKEFTLEDFSCEHLMNDVIEDFTGVDEAAPEGITFCTNGDTGQMGLLSTDTRDDLETRQSTLVMTQKDILLFIIDALNANREAYLKARDKKYWWQMIQLLPTSYNQKRTVMLNYEVLNNIYHSRKNHKLDEWHVFCDWIRELPYSELITGEFENT